MPIFQLTSVLRLAAGLLLSLPVAAHALDKEGEVEEKKKDPDAITCKSTKVVGSRIPTRVCLTNFEWEDRKRTQMENKRSARNRNSGCSSEGPC